MALENTSDYNAFFDITAHGVSATIGAGTVNGVFNNEFFNIPVDVGVDGSNPMFTCKTSDLTGVSRGDTVTINSILYTIRGIHNDGTGITTLVFEDQ